MGANELIGNDVQILGSSTVTINTATTTNFNFGSPTDINLAAAANLAKLKAGGRIIVVFSASTAGTTDPVSFSVQDANDSAGSIGTPATGVTDKALTGGTGSQYASTAVQVQPGRPWIRCRVTRTGTTDTHVVHAVVLAIPQGI